MSAPAGEPVRLVIDRRHSRSIRARLITPALELVTAPYLRKLIQAPLNEQALAGLGRLDSMAARVRPPRGTRIEPFTIDGLRAQWVHGAGVGSGPGVRDRVILYLHGGGWLFGGLNSHRSLVSRISRASGVPALALDYRMVPVVDFDQEIEDCVTGYRWLLDSGVPPGRIVIAGDSAGGYLTVATALRARDHGLPMPGGLVGISGVYDMSTASKAAHANSQRDPAGSLAALEWMFEAVLGGLDPADPKVSPVHADLTGLPRTLLTASASEIIYCDSEKLAELLVQAGVPCTLQVWSGQAHVFQALAVLPEARRAIRDIGAFVRDVVRPV